MSTWILFVLFAVCCICAFIFITLFIYKRIKSKEWNFNLFGAFITFVCISFVLLLFLSINMFQRFGDTWQNLHKDEKTQPITEKKSTLDFVKELKKFEHVKYKNQIPDDYYTYYGFRDYWRFPTVFPYSIICIDVLDYGHLYNDTETKDFKQGGSFSVQSDYFDEFTFDKNVIICKKCKTRFDADSVNVTGYFILEFSTGKTIQSTSLSETYKKAKQLNYSGDTSFTSIKNYASKF
jgi:uncharacterized membrane protein